MQKRILLLIAALLCTGAVVLFAFQNGEPYQMQTLDGNDYEKEWREIDSLTGKGLYRSALEKTEALYERVQKEAEENPAQVVKALLYRARFEGELSDDEGISAMTVFQKEMKTADYPAKPILQSIMAELYLQFLEQNRYKLEDRSTVASDVDQDDIRNWDLQRLTKRIHELYWASLQSEKLRSLKLESIDAILDQSDAKLRPSVYDILAQRAISFFSNAQNYLTEPAYKFYVEDAEVFADAETFVEHELQTRDSLSQSYQTLRVFQNWTALHLEDTDPATLINISQNRLEYAKDKSVHPRKDSLYLAALEALAKKYPKAEETAEVKVAIAQHYYAQVGGYSAMLPESQRWMRKKAFQLCDKIREEYPRSIGAKQAMALQSIILEKGMSIYTDKVALPNEALLGRLTYSNLDEVHFRIIPLSVDEFQELQKEGSQKQLELLVAKKASEKWKVAPDDGGDFLEHQTEFKIPALKKGIYVLLGSEAMDFRIGRNGLALQYIFVSEIGFLHRDEKRKNAFVFTHRKTGAPLSNVKVDLFEQAYNSRNREYDYKRKGGGTTNSKGMLKTALFNNSIMVKAEHNGDVLYTGDYIYNYSYYGNGNNRRLQKVHFFTDRAIYRPGQTVYFKGIVYDTDQENSFRKIAANRAVTVDFLDANYQKVNSLDLKTNEYGSIEGAFTAPSAGLLGRMQLRVGSDGNTSFRVEEYKRPRFEVTFHPAKGSFKLNQEVQVKGEAKAYAGSVIDGAQVRYRVTRTASYPYWRWGWWQPTKSSQQIAVGETTTDESGQFEINFPALPDRSISAEQKPQFNYKVEVDIIDITGETHSATQQVSVGYVALAASLQIETQLLKGEKTELKVETRNLNGTFEAAEVEVYVEQLDMPKQLYRSRYWTPTEDKLLSKKAFQKDFPHYAYMNEDQASAWPVSSTKINQRFSTDKQKTLSLNTADWDPGSYRIRLKTADKYGTPVELSKQIVLVDPKAKKAPLPEAQFIYRNATKAEPGETITLQLMTAAKETHYLFEVERNGELLRQEWVKSDQNAKIELPIEEAYRGNVHYQLYSVYDNRLMQDRHTVRVPWSNKKLDIEYATFRDKLRPGQEEEWQIKIKGPKGDAVAAEMVTSLYDASLDAFVMHNWDFSIYPYSSAALNWSENTFSAASSNLYKYDWYKISASSSRSYPQLNLFGANSIFYSRRMMQRSGAVLEEMQMSAEAPTASSAPAPAPEGKGAMTDSVVITNERSDDTAQGDDKQQDADLSDVKARSNLNETVFFFPRLETDAEGNIIIKFTMNEALTRWKLLGFAHTKDLKYSLTQQEIVTQKELMVTPNAPRFMRQKDELVFTAKVSNMTESEMQGQIQLLLFDALSMQPVDAAYANTEAQQSFTAKAGQSTAAAWRLKVPAAATSVLLYRVVAKSGDFSDGEEDALPILTNQTLVTETMPLPIRGKQNKRFKFNRLMNAKTSGSLRHQQLTLEFTSNPAWYAVQSLPYLMEYPYECSEQTFSRYYANSLASSVANAHPKVKQVFEQWKGTEAMDSKLRQNQELKSALLEETPWVLQAQSEEEQKRNIGLLFDLNRMASEQERALRKLQEMQLSNGGFAWFVGGRDNWYISQYIVEGMGHLDVLGVKSLRDDNRSWKMTQSAIHYVDDRLAEYYTELKKRGVDMAKDHLSHTAIHYLYARSFFQDVPVKNATTEKAVNYFRGQAEKYWLDKSIYNQGMIALAMNRAEKIEKTVQDILKSLKERALRDEELGAYWKYDRGFYWYQLPIETHALMIELFDEVGKDAEMVEELKIWLLKAKQTTHWKTTKSTAAACYALLARGDNWLLEDQPVSIKLGGKELDQSKISKEAGTGYFKKSWSGSEVQSNMGDVRVKNPNKSIAWGAMYWQYFEDLDKVTHFKETPLKLNKQVFKQVSSDRGTTLQPIKEQTTLEPGDLLTVRVELQVDRDMEYVHLKDMRASGLEPTNVLSQYKYQGGLGYYESTRDVSTNFFIGYLPKGSYVFEYPLRVNHRGDFSNGITTIQCMYAPEFTAHSEGIRLKVQ